MPAGRPPGPKRPKITVSLESEELRRYIDDEIRRGQLEGRLPENYTRSDWINEAIRSKRAASPGPPPPSKKPKK